MRRISRWQRSLRQLALLVACSGGWLLAAAQNHPVRAQSQAQIQQAQQELNSLGFDAGSADGFIGPRTKSAVRAYQAKKGLNATGELDDSTLSSLTQETPANAPPPAITSPTTSSDGGSSAFLWILIIGGGLYWLFKKAKKSAKEPSSDMRTAAVKQAAPQYPAAAGSGSTWSRSPTTPQALSEQGNRCWVPLGKTTSVASYTLSGGIYVGAELPRQDGRPGDNCLINPSLKVSARGTDTSGANMPYWPSYSLVTPECRSAYLKWLSSDRSDPSTYIGYVFLYFYGLERRLMLDSPGTEAPEIIAEVQRLQSIFHDNNSFKRYSSALLNAASVRFWNQGDWPPLSLQKDTWQLPLPLLMAVGTAINNGVPLNAIQMLTWYNCHPDKRLPSLASRCPEEFKELFKSRFDAKFPNGILVASPKRALSGSYRAASSSFSVQFQVGTSPIPDVSGLTAPLNLIESLVEACGKDLSTYARLIGKDRTARTEMAAAAALPDQLLSGDAAGPLMRLKSWLDQQTVATTSLVGLKDLLERVGAAPTPFGPASRPDLLLAAEALARCGFGMEPDPKIPYPSSQATTEVAVFRAKDGARPNEVTAEFLGALAQLDIGMLIASADEHIASQEIDLLRARIFRDPALSDLEKTRLNARVTFLAKYPPSNRIIAKFKDRPLADREAIASLAVAVAAADGTVAVEEVRTLEKLYKSLNLEASKLYSDIQEFNRGDDVPPVVASGDISRSIPVPARPKLDTKKTLDVNRLAKTRAETAVVSSILGEIFSDEHGTPANVSISPISGTPGASSPDGPRFRGLDPKYASLLATLAERSSMNRGDFEALANTQHLMCDGAIEAINDWSYDRFDGPLLDDGSQIIVNKDILRLAEGN